MIVDPGPASLERLLRDAGLGPGMRVLDVGCGYGAVAAVAAALVGPAGEVVAIDRDEAVLAVARERAGADSVVRFVRAEVERPPAGPFDAVVGRRVLMYVPNAGAAVAALAATLRPGGVMAFQEIDGVHVPFSTRPHPLHDELLRVVWETVRREGADPTLAQALPALLRGAGLSVEDVRAEAVVQTAERRTAMAAMIRAIAHRIEGQGVAAVASLDLDTLDARLEAELVASGETYVSDLVFGVWGRRPG